MTTEAAQAVASSARPRGQGPPPPGGPVPGPDSNPGNNRDDRAHPSEHPRGPGPIQNGQGQPQHLGPAVITSHPGIVAQAARVCQYALRAMEADGLVRVVAPMGDIPGLSVRHSCAKSLCFGGVRCGVL